MKFKVTVQPAYGVDADKADPVVDLGTVEAKDHAAAVANAVGHVVRSKLADLDGDARVDVRKEDGTPYFPDLPTVDMFEIASTGKTAGRYSSRK